MRNRNNSQMPVLSQTYKNQLDYQTSIFKISFESKAVSFTLLTSPKNINGVLHGYWNW